MIAAGHGVGLALFPLGAAVIAAVFGAMLLVSFARKRRPHEGLWTVALFMFAAASAAMFLGVVGGWSTGEFRVYWLLGAVLNVPYLAQGELYLLFHRRPVAHGIAVALLLLTAVAAWEVIRAPISVHALAKSLPLGKDVFGTHSAAYRISQFYAFPAYFLLLGGTAWSAYRMKGRPELRDRTAGTVGIAVGATIVAIGSGVGAGFNNPPLFSVSLALGIAVMFAGFLRASGRTLRRARTGAG